MKVLIYSPYTAWPKHFYTSLDIALKHQNQGDQVHLLICESSPQYCETNINHHLKDCLQCHLKEINALDQIKHPRENRHFLQLERFRRPLEIPDFKTFEELKEFQIEGIDFGNAVASSLISVAREPLPRGIEMYSGIISRLLEDAVAVYQAVSYYLEKLQPELFYLFNGRFSLFRPALRAARKMGVKTLVHERAGVINRYLLTENTLPHDLEYIKNEIELHWQENSDFSEKEKAAANWFTERKMGKDQSWFAFTRMQKPGKLPENFDHRKRNIVIFNSSVDEVQAVAIDNPWNKHFYPNHQEAIARIVNDCGGNNFHFYLRSHPNLRGLQNSQTREISALSHPDLTVISPADDSDTYALMDACEKVLAFRSTTGIESAFWGKPVILIDRAFHEDLGSCYVPQSHDETLSLLKSVLSPLPVTGALKFGYWESTKGELFQYTEHRISGNDYQVNVLGQTIDAQITSHNKEDALRVILSPREKTFYNLTNQFDLLKELSLAPVWSKDEQTFLEKNAAVTRQEISQVLQPGELKISVCIIVRRDHPNLENCLKAAGAFAWELIVLDGGLSENSRQMSRKYAKVLAFSWENDFSKAKNYGLESAAGNWVLFSGPDDQLPRQTIERMVIRLKSLPLLKDPLVFWFRKTEVSRETGEKKDCGYKPVLLRNGFGINFTGAVDEFPQLDTYPLKSTYCPELEIIRLTSDLENKQELIEKISLLEEIVNRNEFIPEMTGFYFSCLATAYLEAGKLEKAANIYQQALIRLDEPELIARINLELGRTLLLSGRRTEGLKLLHKARESLTDARTAVIHLLRFAACSDDLPMAVNNYLALYPDLPAGEIKILERVLKLPEFHPHRLETQYQLLINLEETDIWLPGEKEEISAKKDILKQRLLN